METSVKNSLGGIYLNTVTLTTVIFILLRTCIVVLHLSTALSTTCRTLGEVLIGLNFYHEEQKRIQQGLKRKRLRVFLSFAPNFPAGWK